MSPNNSYKLQFLTALLALMVQLGASSTADAQQLDSIVEVTEAPEEEAAYSFQPLSAADTVLLRTRTVANAKVAHLKQEGDFWYVNEAPKRAQEKKKVSETKRSGSGFFNQAWFKTLLWVLVIGGFIVILIWFLMSSNIQLFRKKSGAVGRTPDGEDDENIFEIDYEAETAKAVERGEFHLAIRLRYLHLLRDLALKGLIQYKQEYTNSDYLLQLQDRSYGPAFRQLTRSFEYAWYGRFPISGETFRMIEAQFFHLRKTVL